MFGFMDMAENLDERKVDRYEIEGLTISTVFVTDSDWEYETAVSHLSYNDGSWMIVEGYDDKERAQKGHLEWVDKMIAEELPELIEDISTASIVKLGLALGIDARGIHKKA